MLTAADVTNKTGHITHLVAVVEADLLTPTLPWPHVLGTRKQCVGNEDIWRCMRASFGS